jgi:hypothetical protein
MLKNVKDDAEEMRKASIDENLQLRVDILGEGAERSKARPKVQTLGNIPGLTQQPAPELMGQFCVQARKEKWLTVR